MRLSYRALTVAAGAGLLIAACQALDVKYEEATLEEALKGQVPSKTLRYDVPVPRIAVTRRNTGIIRDQSLFVVIVGPSLHDVVEKYRGPDVRYGVRLVKEPMTHLVLERVFQGGEKIDLFEGIEGFRLELPSLVTYQEVDVAKYPPLPVDQLASAAPGLHLVSGLVIEKRRLSEEEAALLAAHSEIGRPDRPKYFLQSEAGALVVTHGEPMTLMMLDFLVAEKKDFEGGLRIADPFPAKVREATRVVAPANVHWAQLGGAIYYRAHGSPPR